MKNYSELLKDVITSVKYCQRAVICSSDGLVVKAFPETDTELNEALSASATSILGVTSSVSQRAGKSGNDYVLIKNKDSFLLVFFIGNISLFLVADARVNLGMLLHVGKILRGKLTELNKEFEQQEPEKEPEETCQEIHDKTTDEQVLEAVETIEAEEIMVEESGELPETITTTHIVETEIEDENSDETEKVIVTQSVEITVPEESDKEDEATLELVADEEMKKTERTNTETKFVHPESDDEFRFSDENESDKNTQPEKPEKDEEQITYKPNTDAVKVVFESDENTKDEQDFNKIQSMIPDENMDETNHIESEEKDENDKPEPEKEESYQSFISWRERLELERENENEDKTEDTDEQEDELF